LFKGLTQRAQRILSVNAQEEGRRFHADQLLPEHIVMAILKEGSGTACKVLAALNVDLDEFRHELEKDLPDRSAGFIFGDLPPSRRARTMLETAADEARSFGHDYVGTEHLLLAAMREDGAQVFRFLTRHSISAAGGDAGRRRPGLPFFDPAQHQRRPAAHFL